MSSDKIDYADDSRKNDADDDKILPLEQITIKEVRLTDGTKITNELLECFFSPEGSAGDYMFFEQDGVEKGNSIKGGMYFEFKMADKIWVLKTNFHAKEMKAHGDWHSFGPDDTDEGGTFTAQAGGGLETVASASA